MDGTVSAASTRGFALPLAAVAVALLSLGLAMALPPSDQLAREVRHARARLALERAAMSAETRVSYLLLTEPVGWRGLNVGGVRLAADGSLISASEGGARGEIVLDGRPYELRLDSATQVIVRVQEKAGLINMEDADRSVLANLLHVCGMPRSDAAALSALLPAERANMRAGMDDRTALAKLGSGDQSRDALLRLVSGDRRAKLDSAITVMPAGTGLHLPTAPETVVMALFGSNAAQAQAFLDSREGTINAIKMNAINNQNGNNVLSATVKRALMTGRMRLSIEIKHSQLTIGLPMYFYQSDMEVDLDHPDQSFVAKGPIVYAGRHAQCAEPVGAVVKPLPGYWPSRR